MKYTELAEGMGVEFQSQHYEKQGYYFFSIKKYSTKYGTKNFFRDF